MNSGKNFGQRILERRKAAGLTQKKLGEEAGLSMQAINDIEHGRRNTTMSNVILLAHALDTSVEYLIGETDDPMRRPEPSNMEQFFLEEKNVSVVHRLTLLADQRGVSIDKIKSIAARSTFTHGYMKQYDLITLAALADYFDVSLDYLVGRSNDPTRH